MKLLVLGAQGQLGQELAALCAVRGIATTLMTRRQCDLANPGQIRAAIEGSSPSIIVNAAAYTKVDQAEKEAGLAQLANCDGPAMLAQASADAGIPLIHVSTDYVFDGSKPSAYVETDPVMPLGVYGLSKEAGERAIRSIQDRHIIVRTAWVYGVYGRNFLKTMLDLAATREGWGVVNDQVGNPTGTADLAEALLAAAEKTSGNDTCWGTYHFAGQGDATWFEFAEEIVAAQAAFTGKHPVLKATTTEDYPTPARRPRNSRLNSDLFASVFGVRALPWQTRTRNVVEAIFAQRRGRG
ncbi:MAG: dTDP-4-dehydrorhamnose reductase [Reyranella sp.]|nr:dTDP-4-dehydrorhamnose reductase [Reyranella sp.]MDP3159621.1 dTDP-4-dehydrorhamnose reductase [Reyranella sp.]